MNIFKRFFFALNAFIIVCLLLVFVSLFTIPAGLYFIGTGRYLGWADQLVEKMFDYVDKSFTGLSEKLNK